MVLMVGIEKSGWSSRCSHNCFVVLGKKLSIVSIILIALSSQSSDCPPPATITSFKVANVNVTVQFTF